MFGIGGTQGGSIKTTVTGTWGNDLNNVPVTSLAGFNAAVALLRTPAGHNPASAGSFANPPAWSIIEAQLALTDNSKPSNAIDSNPNATLASLAAIGLVPLCVTQLSCKTFDFTVDLPSQPGYFGERWELYKHQYVLARWLYVRGVVKQEFWNEPDLTAGSSDVGAQCMSPSRWLEQYTVRCQAVQNAYADLNADVAANRMSCPALVDRSMLAAGAPNCPMTPALTTAFASRTFKGEPPSPTEFFGYPTVSNQQLKFPPYANVTDPTWANLGAYAYHSYGKEGYDLAKATRDLQAQTNSELPAGSRSLALLTTEHASKTASSWNLGDSSSDDYYEAARLASQLIWMSDFGLESYVFKMTSTPSNNAGIVKSGLHWGENDVFPYPVGDTTRSGEAARMVIAPMVGRAGAGKLPLYTCTTSTGSAYRPCNLVNDNGLLTMVIVNDAVISTPTGSKAPQSFAMKVSLAAMATQLGLVDGGIAVVNELSTAGFNNEVSSLQPLYRNQSWSFTVMLPTWGVLSITLPTGAQTNTALAATADASLFATGASAVAQGAANTLTVGTSVTSDHSTTSVALLKFDASSFTAASISAAILELTVAAAPSAAAGPSVMTIYALSAAASAAWAEGSVTWATASAAPVSLLNASVTGVIGSVVQNFVNHASGVTIAGHITVSPGDVGALKRVDVSDAVRGASGAVSFAIVRRMRNNLYTGNVAPAAGIPADKLSAGAAVAFASKEATAVASRPVLRVLVNGAPASALPLPRAAQVATSRNHANDQDYESTTDTDLSDADPEYIVVSSIASMRAQNGEVGACASWESPLMDHFVTVKGTVIAVFGTVMASGQFGFVLQDSTDAFSGLLVQLSAEQAGALASGAGYMPVVGNVVRVDGVVGHTLGNTVLEQVSAVTVVTPRVALPMPVAVTAASLARGCTLASEQYRNMVVSMSNLRFTIDPTDLTAAQYAAAIANFGSASFQLNADGELYVDDGSGPVQLDNKLFDVVAQLGWASGAGKCGAKLGDLIDALMAVAVFDDSQSKVSYQLGNPPTMELNIIKITSAEISPCTPVTPAAPAALNATTSAAASLTLSGINASTFDIAAAQTAIKTLFGRADTVTVVTTQFPITGASLSFATDAPLDGALAANTRVALQRAFASFNAPLMPASMALSGPRAAGGRRHLASARASFGLDVSGVTTSRTASLVTAAMSGMTAPAMGSRGLASKLVALGVVGAASPSLDAAPTVAAVLSVTVTYAVPPSQPAAALTAALAPAAVARALAGAGVATTGVTSSLQQVAHTDDHRDAIIGGVIGGFFGLVLLAAAVVLLARRSKGSSNDDGYAGKSGKSPRQSASEPASMASLEAPRSESAARAPAQAAQAALAEREPEVPLAAQAQD